MSKILRPKGLFLSSTQPFYKIDWRENRLSVNAPLSSQEWDVLVEVMQEHSITKLRATGISDAGLECVSRLPLLTHLDVSGSKTLTDAGAKNLERMPQLVELTLGGRASPLTDEALAPLAQMAGLRQFQISWTPGISDRGAAYLSSCSYLEAVSLMGTSTGDEAIRALAGKAHLRKFESGKSVTDAGLKMLHEFPVFKSWRGGEARLSLMDACSEPNHLLLDGPFTNTGIVQLSGLEGIFALGFFWHSEAFTSAGLAPLRRLPHLAVFDCQGERCDDEAMSQIASLPHLRKLAAQGAVASDAGFAALSASQSLEYFWGRMCPNLRSQGFLALARMPALRGLAVSCQHVNDAALSLLPTFPALREFMPMDVPDAAFRHVGRCERLEALWCMYCRETGDAATEQIGGLQRLQTYYAGMTRITDRSLAILSKMETIERLEFWQCAGLTDSGIAHLVSLPRLREIKLNELPGVSRKALELFPENVAVHYSG